MRGHSIATGIRGRLPAVVLLALFACPRGGVGQDWPGTKAQWHGYDQFRFQVDDRPAYVVIPRQPARGKPWVWRARFPDYHPEVDLALLERGFHVAYIDVAGLYGAPQAVAYGEKFFALLTDRYGLSNKPVLEGVSRGGLFVYNWAIRHLENVACIYCDTPVMDIKSWPGGKGSGVGSAASWARCLRAYGMTEEQALAYDKNPIDHAEAIVQAGIPILHIVSENDRVVPPAENTYLARQRLSERLQRNFHVMSVRQGTAKSQGHHFAHPNPAAVVGFIVQHAISNATSSLPITGGNRSSVASCFGT